MSFEQYPGREDSMHQLADWSAEALAQEDWTNVQSPLDAYGFESMRLCRRLAHEFASYHHLTDRAGALLAATSDIPLFLDQLVLQNANIYIPSCLPNGKNLSTVLPRDAEVGYFTIELGISNWDKTGRYEGPHMLGVIDTDELGPGVARKLKIPKGNYTFLSPFKTVRPRVDTLVRKFN